MKLRSRYQGCLIGLATGDALGAQVEFMPPGSFPPVTDMSGGGKYNLLPGQWTDDTSTALCLAESLLLCKTHDPHDQLNRYSRWYQTGHLSSNGTCFDIGKTFREGVWRHDKNPQEPYPGISNPLNAGNGSLMKVAPIPMFYRGNVKRMLEVAELSSRTTHGAPSCIQACQYYSLLIRAAFLGVEKDILLSEEYLLDTLREQDITDFVYGEIVDIVKGSYRKKEPPIIHGGAFVVVSLEAALWAFAKSSNFQDGALLIVNLGGDADTTTAIYGMLAGAYYGVESIPLEWVTHVSFSNLISTYADALCFQSAEGVLDSGLPAPADADPSLDDSAFAFTCEAYRILQERYNDVLRCTRPGPKMFRAVLPFDQAHVSFEALAQQLPLPGPVEPMSVEGNNDAAATTLPSETTINAIVLQSLSREEQQQVVADLCREFRRMFVIERTRIVARFGDK